MTAREFLNLSFSKLGKFLSYPFRKIKDWVNSFFNLFKKPSSKTESSEPKVKTPLPDIINIPKIIFPYIKSRSYDAEVDEKGMTPLMHAVLANDIEAVKKLLANPLNINQENRKSYNMPDTALGLAVQNANIEMVTLLLEHGASIELGQFLKIDKAEREKNLAHISRISTDSVLDFFPEASAVSHVSKSEYEHRKTEIFKLIANKGNIIVTQPSLFYKTMLATGHLPTLKATFDFIKKNQERSYSLSYNGSTQNLNFRFDIFYEPFSDLNLSSYSYASLYHKKPLYRYHYNHNAISFAMANNQEEAALFLLKNLPANLHNNAQIQADTLIFAIYYNQKSVINFCLDHLSIEKISEHFNESNGFTALMAAAYVGNIELMKTLLERGVDINHQNDWRFYIDTERNYTALYSAIASDKNLETKQEIITLLLNNGAKLNASTLEKIASLNLELNLEKVTHYIELIGEKENDIAVRKREGAYVEPASYAHIIEQIKQHNEKVKSKTLEALENALPNTPKVITDLISEYLPLSPIIKKPDSSESETEKTKKPKP